jgi:zinc protease
MLAVSKIRTLKILLIGCLAAGCIAFGKSKSPQIPAHPRDLKFPPLQYTPPKASTYRQVLSNGAIAFFVEDRDLPLVNISVIVRVGAYLDPAGKEGLAAAVGGQMRLGGTAHYKADVFDEEADYLAAELSSAIGATSGRASANFMAKDTEKAMELFFDMFRNPAFQQNRLDIYKGQMLQAMERRNDRTDDIEGREWNRLLRGDSHFTNAFSTKASISSLAREDLIEFHKKYYHPKNFILAVSGDFKTAEMKAKLEKAMEGWETGTIPPKAPKPNYAPVPGVYMVNKPDVNQSRVSIGHIGIMRGNPDEFAIDMMNDILGGAGFTSRITNRVRSDEGLAYEAGSAFGAGVFYEGLFRAGYQSKSPTAAQAARIVLDEIERIRRDKVSREELETVKNQAIEVFPRIFATASSIANTFASDEYTERDPTYWETYRQKVKAVTIDDVQRVAREYLHPDKLVILVVGNVEENLKGNQEKPEFSFMKIASGKITRIPLPDPLTMVYPK